MSGINAYNGGYYGTPYDPYYGLTRGLGGGYDGTVSSAADSNTFETQYQAEVPSYYKTSDTLRSTDLASYAALAGSTGFIGLDPIYDNALNAAGWLTRPVVNAFPETTAAISNGAKSVWNGVSTGVSDAYNWAANGISDASKRIVGADKTVTAGAGATKTAPGADVAIKGKDVAAPAAEAGTTLGQYASLGLSAVGAGLAVYDIGKRFSSGDHVGGSVGTAGLVGGGIIGAGSTAAATTSVAGATAALGGAAAGAGAGIAVYSGVKDIVNGDYLSGGLTLGGVAAGATAGAMATSWSGPGMLIGAAVGGAVGMLGGSLFGKSSGKAGKKAEKKITKNIKKSKSKAYEEGKKAAREAIKKDQVGLIQQTPEEEEMGNPNKLGADSEASIKKIKKAVKKGKKKKKIKKLGKEAEPTFTKEVEAAYAKGFNEVMKKEIPKREAVAQQQAQQQQASLLQEQTRREQLALQQQQAYKAQQAQRAEELARQQQILKIFSTMQQMASGNAQNQNSATNQAPRFGYPVQAANYAFGGFGYPVNGFGIGSSGYGYGWQNDPSNGFAA